MPSSGTARRWWLVAIAVACGIAEPYVEIAWKCRAGFETSEACVWGKAFLPMGRWVAPLFVAPVVFVVLLALTALWSWIGCRASRRRRARERR